MLRLEMFISSLRLYTYIPKYIDIPYEKLHQRLELQTN